MSAHGLSTRRSPFRSVWHCEIAASGGGRRRADVVAPRPACATPADAAIGMKHCAAACIALDKHAREREFANTSTVEAAEKRARASVEEGARTPTRPPTHAHIRSHKVVRHERALLAGASSRQSPGAPP